MNNNFKEFQSFFNYDKDIIKGVTNIENSTVSDEFQAFFNYNVEGEYDYKELTKLAAPDIYLEICEEYEKYEGEYEVTPRIVEQMLLTKDKVMKDNVKVKEIPFYEVDNLQNGKTVYIG